MLFEHSSYRSYLRKVLADRITNNPAYSMRAMAMNLGIASSTLSEVIKGSANLSVDRGAVIAKKLALNEDEQEYFTLLVQKESASSVEVKEQIQNRMQRLNPGEARQIRDLSLDVFKVMSEWYYYVIAELVTMKDFEFTPENIAEKIGISPVEAEAAIGRLERVDMIEKDHNGKYVAIPGRVQISSAVPNQALRTFHKRMMEMAIESLETQMPNEKFVGSETFAFDPADLPKANQEIENMFTKLIALARAGKNRSEVFHAGVQLFNLTKKSKSSRLDV